MAKHVAAERIGQRLEQERNRLGLTQEDAAKKIDVSHRTYQRWENGEVMPFGRNLLKIAKAFEMEAAELLALRGEILEEGVTEQLARIEAKLDAVLAELFPQVLGDEAPGSRQATDANGETPASNETNEAAPPPAAQELP